MSYTGKKTVLHALVSLAAFIIIVIPLVYYIPYLIHNYRPWLLDIRLGKLRYAGLVFIVLGTAVILWGYLTFIFVGRGTPFHAMPVQKLIIRGLYRHVRNPMVIGVLSVFLGEAIFFESTVILVYMIIGISIYNLFLLLYEEPQLRRRFGDSYKKYCNEVPRWIPRFKPYHDNDG